MKSRKGLRNPAARVETRKGGVAAWKHRMLAAALTLAVAAAVILGCNLWAWAAIVAGAFGDRYGAGFCASDAGW